MIYRALSLGTHEEGLFESNCEVEKEGDREAGDYMITGKKGEKKTERKKNHLQVPQSLKQEQMSVVQGTLLGGGNCDCTTLL